MPISLLFEQHPQIVLSLKKKDMKMQEERMSKHRWSQTGQTSHGAHNPDPESGRIGTYHFSASS
jgi:hypothetical protein